MFKSNFTKITLLTLPLLLLTACVDNSITAKSNSNKKNDLEQTLSTIFETEGYSSAKEIKETKTKDIKSDIKYTLATIFKIPDNSSSTEEIKEEKTEVMKPEETIKVEPKETKSSPLPVKTPSLATTIKKSDKVKPIIALVGATTIALTVGDTYIDKGAKATDNTDGDITHKLWKKGTVDTQKAGAYSIEWAVNDNAGNLAKVYRKVIVNPAIRKEENSETIEPKIASNTYSIREYGAACDGTTDDTAAFQAAIDEASANRKVAVVPSGCSTLFKSRINLKDHTSLLKEEGAIVTAKNRITGMYVQHIDININGELRQPEYFKTHNDDGSITEEYWLLRGTSGRFGTNPLYPGYAREGDPVVGYYGMKAYNCTGEGTDNVKCDHSKGTNSVGWGKSDRGIIEILANEYKSSNDKYELDHFPGQFDADYGHYKIHSSKRTGKITGPWKKSDLNPLSQKHYGKNFNALNHKQQAIINRTFMGTLKGMGTKGIAFFKARNVEVTGLTISGFSAETIYINGPRGNVKFTHNKILNANTTGLNFNGASRCDNCEISDNEVYDAHGGIEASVGDVLRNKLVRCHLGVQTGGALGKNNTKFNDNTIIGATGIAAYITYGKEHRYTGIEFKRNKIINSYQNSLKFQNIAGFIMEDNIIEGYGEGLGGTAVKFIRNVTGVMKNNIFRKAKMMDSQNQNDDYIVEGSNIHVSKEKTRCIKWDESGDRSCQ